MKKQAITLFWCKAGIFAIVAFLLVCAVGFGQEVTVESPTRAFAEIQTADIRDAMPQVIEDELFAPQESKEIVKVLRDIKEMRSIADDDEYIEHAERLKQDFAALKSLDKYLQNVELI